MSIGNYGNIRSADVRLEDIEILYTFSQDRQTESLTVYKIDPTTVLKELKTPESDQISGDENLLEGLMNLRLPADIFNSVGIYNIFIRPKAIRTKIIDCGVLSALPNVRGILLDSTLIDSGFSNNNALQGYRIEYINDDGTKLRNVFRIITTSNKCVPVTENIGNTSQTAIRYRFDDSGSLLFLQLTPTSASNVKPNIIPFIGTPDQDIIIYNTFFNPISFEVELVENDIDTLVDLVAGEQLRDVDNGIVTYYDENRNITRQFKVYKVKEEVDKPTYEVKERVIEIDDTQDIGEVIDSIE